MSLGACVNYFLNHKRCRRKALFVRAQYPRRRAAVNRAPRPARMSPFKHLALLSFLLVILYTSSVLSQPNPYQWIQPPRPFERIIEQLKEKRKPSIGLSLAEYVADPTRADNFHFLNGRKKRSVDSGS